MKARKVSKAPARVTPGEPIPSLAETFEKRLEHVQ